MTATSPQTRPVVALGRDATSVGAGRDRFGGMQFLGQVPALLLLTLIRVYQRTLGPALPVLTAGACGCRFAPTCSHYAAEAIRTHGALAGVWFALRRLVKCTPLHPGGFDPVPPLRRARPVCHSAR